MVLRSLSGERPVLNELGFGFLKIAIQQGGQDLHKEAVDNQDVLELATRQKKLAAIDANDVIKPR